MQVKIASPKHYEAHHGSSELVRGYLDRIEKTLGESILSETIDILRISLLIATPEELSQGKFLAYENFDWRCGYIAVGVKGDFERYHSGDDLEKICQIAEMLRTAFQKVGKKRKAKFAPDLADQIVTQVTRAFTEGLPG